MAAYLKRSRKFPYVRLISTGPRKGINFYDPKYESGIAGATITSYWSAHWEVGRPGAIAAGVALLHILAIWLLLQRLAPEHHAEWRPETTFVQLPPVSTQPTKQRRQSRSPKRTSALPDYHWIVSAPGINPGPLAITSPPLLKFKIPPSSGEDRHGSCPKVLALNSEAWRHCIAPTPPLAPKKEGEWQEFGVPPEESVYANRWKTEKRARENTDELPCTSNTERGDPNFASNQESGINVDFGCAARKLFGH